MTRGRAAIGGRGGLLLAIAPLLLAGCLEATPCPSPLSQCGDTCFDLRSDRLHCGACGNACGAGLGCVGGACTPGQDASCPLRTGGAFVTLGACGGSVKLWVTSGTFLGQAEALLANPAAPGFSLPRFDLRAGQDCDGQWSWHADAVTAAFVSGADTICDACPGEVEAARPYWLVEVGVWCPSAARILAVDRR